MVGMLPAAITAGDLPHELEALQAFALEQNRLACVLWEQLDTNDSLFCVRKSSLTADCGDHYAIVRESSAVSHRHSRFADLHCECETKYVGSICCLQAANQFQERRDRNRIGGVHADWAIGAAWHGREPADRDRQGVGNKHRVMRCLQICVAQDTQLQFEIFGHGFYH